MLCNRRSLEGIVEYIYTLPDHLLAGTQSKTPLTHVLCFVSLCGKIPLRYTCHPDGNVPVLFCFEVSGGGLKVDVAASLGRDKD